MIDTQQENEKPVILVIEDNDDDWMLIRWALLQHFHETEVVWLPDTDQVLSYLKTSSTKTSELPKLILLDLYLPGARQGIRTLQTLKSHYLFCQIPVVTLSRSHHPDDISEALCYSSNGYLVKPDSYTDWIRAFRDLGNYWKKPIPTDTRPTA